ncbi:ABC transporter permease [Oceanibacterium hippocampi]|uniref:Inner membrane ABC transporter permease protein YdcV n=1 Tax=Oceanibacterium hippocampi TaxID=745714 RepID=A0A1Y5R8U1_9PROT|nr:ABC transporter permease [Oceanibacterium hippocampi]SLN11119.1 Inner membrane ABC transporter permease protein YdcV [Oceanibacterium hippocampi]
MRLLRTAFMTLVAVFLALPLIVIAGISLNEKRFLSFPPEGLSLRWYGELFADAGWLAAVERSLIVATLAGLLALTIAVPIAYLLWRHGLAYAKALYGLGIAPFMLPPVILALGYLIFWTSAGNHGQLENVVIAHAIFLTALPLITTSLGFEAINREVVEAARTMGAGEITVVRTVILPLIRPYMLSGFAFAYVLSLNEYIIAFMTVGFTYETLPVKIFNALRYGYSPVMAVVAVLFMAMSVTIFGLIARFGDLPRLLGAWAAKED